MPRKAWKVLLSATDVLDMEMQIERATVSSFSVHLRHFDGTRWKPVWRTDTAHGRLHVHATNGRIRNLETNPSQDYAQAFTRAQKYAKEHWAALVAQWRLHEGRRDP